MPTFTTTAKHALRRLSGSNAISDVDAGFGALADDIDPKLTPHASGLASARPTSTVETPGKEGRTYRATDTGAVYLDSGSGWITLTLGVGEIREWPFPTAPDGWLMLNGQTITATDYPVLVALLGGGSSQPLPDARGKVTVHRDATQTEFDTLGETGGAKTHTLTVGQLPEHTHQFIGGLNAGSETRAQLVLSSLAPYGVSEVHAADVRDASGNAVTNGQAHNNLQPYLVLNKIIRAL
jgi:microcystin-dependent protein